MPNSPASADTTSAWTAVIPTRNRRRSLLGTLGALAALPEAGSLGVVVADNASADGTAAAVRGFRGARTLGGLRLLERADPNPCAGRNEAAAAGSGRFLLFLDDDSSPRPGTLAAAEAAFAADPRLGAVGGPSVRPDGTEDACALPALSAACGWAVRRDAFERAGGFDPDLFMQAEELDLTCRLLAAGFSVGRRPGVRFEHRRTAGGRHPLRTRRLDLRNNLFLASRWLPAREATQQHEEMAVRYGRLLGDETAAEAAAAEAAAMAVACPDSPLPGAAAESLYGFERQAEAVRCFGVGAALDAGAPIALCGFTKHAGITRVAAERCGLRVVAVVDDADAFRGLSLGGVPVVGSGDRPAAEAAAFLHTDLNPGRPRPGRSPRPSLFLRDASPRDAAPA